MTGAVLDLAASIAATMLVMLVPGAGLVLATRATRVLPAALVPAAAAAGTVLLASPLLALTLWRHWSIVTFGTLLAITGIALLAVGILRVRRAASGARAGRVRSAAPYALPASVLVVLGLFDAPQVRSDTYWHVALARRLSELDGLSSARIAFEAGSGGNANYPLPTWHALIALADHAPRVDVWSATWFCTLWLAPVAMLAFAGMAAALVGDRRAGPVGAWTFTAIVVLGYGPWYFATRYLSYPGQAAIFLVLPVVAWAVVHAIGADRGSRAAPIAIAAAGTVAIGVLHGNYVLYPALLAGGGAVLLLVGRRDRVRVALAATAAVVGAGGATLALQLPWIMRDDNFLRGSVAPAGEPTAFIRHRDVFVGSASSFHVELGSLATQPWLVVGALALPALLWFVRRCPGPWVVAGGAVAMVVFARTPQLVELLDRAGSVTPVTRLDRIYPAAIGVSATMLGIGWLLARTFDRGRRIGVASTAAAFAALAAGTWWVDSVRDTRRIVVTQFVEARWVGGLDPGGLPRVAVYGATFAIVAVAIAIRLRVPARELWPSLASPDRSLRHALALGAIVSVAVGLVPATVDRAQATWEPQAYVRADRANRDFARIEVYPAPARAAIARLRPGSVVLASFDETRKVASLVAVQSVEESLLRQVESEPPTSTQALQLLDGDGGPAPRYVVATRTDASFAPIVDAARACGWADRSRGGLWILERRGSGCASAQVDEP